MKSQAQRHQRRWLLAAVISSCGVLPFSLFPSCETTLTTLNPCGTILGFCSPSDVDLLFADVPDFDLDPTCTIPLFDPDDIQGGGGGGGQNQGTCAGQSVFPFTPGARP